jgi:hypothetical protein
MKNQKKADPRSWIGLLRNDIIELFCLNLQSGAKHWRKALSLFGKNQRSRSDSDTLPRQQPESTLTVLHIPKNKIGKPSI